MSTSLNSRSYLVTGGAGAIGLGIAQAIVEQGGRVLLLDLDLEHVSQNAKLVDPGLENSAAAACDVTRRVDADIAVQTALERFGRLDGVINNAGVIAMNAAWDATVDEWQSHFNVNASGAFNMCQAVGRHLKTQASGVVVNVASNCGKVGYPNMAAYNASKAALISLTRSLAAEWAADNINVNAVCPGGVNTAMLAEVAAWLAPRLDEDADELLSGMGAAQLGRRIEPIEVGRVVAFLLSDAAVIIRGQSINVDGGDTPY